MFHHYLRIIQHLAEQYVVGASCSLFAERFTFWKVVYLKKIGFKLPATQI